MHYNAQQRRTWFGRFCQRGGLTLCFAIAVAPFVFHVFHRWWGLSWSSTLILGVPASVAVGHFMMFACVIFPFVVWATLHRGVCPHCQRRGLRGALCSPDPTLTGDPRRFFFSECNCCHHQFWRFDDHTTIHIAPTDTRYTRAT
jgi:hypothetical protein